MSGNSSLILDGVNCGFLKSVDGGAISAEVINEPAGPSYFVKKHIGQPRYQEFEVQVGLNANKALYDWIAQSWVMKYQRKSGSIVAMDYQLNAKSQRQFTSALITETTVPALDGSSKEPAYLTIKFAPEIIRTLKSADKPAGDYGKSEQKLFLPSNFQLQIDGLDCSKVNRIEPLTVKQTAITDDIGEARDHLKEPGKLEFPNLKITVAEAAAQPFIDWHEDFVIQGNNDEKKEKNGTLTLLAPNRKDVLARIKFFNLGIFRVQPPKTEANADQLARVQVEMYVERMEFEFVAAGSGSGSTETKPGEAAPTPTPAKPVTPRLRLG